MTTLQYSAPIGGSGPIAELVFQVRGGEKVLIEARRVLEKCLIDSLPEIRATELPPIDDATPKKKPCTGCPDRVHQGITNPMAFHMAAAFAAVEVLSRSQDAEFAAWESRMGIPPVRLPASDFATA